MPVYRVQCQTCGRTFEKLVFSTSATVLCPECGGETTKLPTTAAFVFRGSGFHATDYPSVDKVVGADAARRWSAIHERQAEKQRLQKSCGPGEAVIREDSGYSVVKESEAGRAIPVASEASTQVS